MVLNLSTALLTKLVEYAEMTGIQLNLQTDD